MITEAHRALIGDEAVLARLAKERGLTRETAARFRLGWIPENRFPGREEWGLPTIRKEDGKGEPKKLLLPAGLVIPAPGRIRIRRSEPGDFGRYYLVPGSNMAPLVIGAEHPPETTPAIMVESELDAILLAQELPPNVSIIAAGSTSYTPDADLIRDLTRRPAVLLAPDNDEAGRKAARKWAASLRNASPAPLPSTYGKDPTEARQAGLDLRLWFRAVLELAEERLGGKVGAPTFADEARRGGSRRFFQDNSAEIQRDSPGRNLSFFPAAANAPGPHDERGRAPPGRGG